MDGYHSLEERLASVAGVRSAGVTSDVPWTGFGESLIFRIDGRVFAPGSEPHARYHAASPGYFHAIGTPLLRGRFFRRSDDEDAPKVLLVNQAMAQRWWPGGDPIDQHIGFGDGNDWMTVVGVIGDTRDAPQTAMATPALWWPERQQPFRNITIAIQAEGDARSVLPAARESLRRSDPELPLANVRTMSQVVSEAQRSSRSILMLTGVFAGVSLLLASIGTYGVLAYSVARRSREFGVRMALGAQPSDVLRMVIRHALALVAVGVTVGSGLALVLGKTAAALLFELSPRDPAAFCAAALLTGAGAILGAYVPARKAASVDPVMSLRGE